jgi:hypothetical protein
MINQQLRTVRALACALLMMVSSIGLIGAVQAQPLDPEAEVIEVMIAAQASDGQFIGRFFGADASSPLSFTSDVNVTGKTFTYSSVLGSMYQDSSISLTTSGAFNTANSLWEWSSIGSLGGTSLNGSGTGSIGETVVGLAGNFNSSRTIFGIKFDYHETVLYSSPILPIASVTAWSFTIDDFPIKSGPGSDLISILSTPPATYFWTTSTPLFEQRVDGFSPLNGGPGGFELNIVPVPEPPTFILLSMGSLSTLSYGWRRRKQAA